MPSVLADPATFDDLRRNPPRNLHEQLWHSSPLDMDRMCQAMQISPAVRRLAADAARKCPDCQQFAAALTKPALRAALALRCNETMQMDLFFLWGRTSFVLFIGEATRWKTGGRTPDKTHGNLAHALLHWWCAPGAHDQPGQ